MVKDSSRLRSFAKEIIDYPYSRDTVVYKGIQYVVSFDYTGDDEDYDDDGRSPTGVVIFTPDRPAHKPTDNKEYDLGWAYSYFTLNGKIVDFDYHPELDVA